MATIKSIEEKAKAYDEAIEKLHEIITMDNKPVNPKEIGEYLFPELKESEDERIRKCVKYAIDKLFLKEKIVCGVPFKEVLSWLEKQGENNKWKPSKEEMDALYGLAYITNKMDDKKDEAITKLYQDLKREFFSGVSYENIFPSNPVDAPIKLEKQGEQKSEPKFKIGDVIRLKGSAAEYTIKRVTDTTYYTDGWSCSIERCEEDYELVEKKPSAWSKEDEKQARQIERIVHDDGCTQKLQKQIADWFKSLKDRVQPKQEWSEEDGVMLDEIIDFFENGTVKLQHDLSLYASWLKHLRPQSQWKPSDEQIHRLKWAVNRMPDTEKANEAEAVLKELLEQLKKL